ncbi:hypothetical protein AOXY_G16708 [Acipenser oxyrinchus oxyrinchus]|uniref:F5/8 type C domain-containing protein n=1 Tax=Acipenser oxyrinchus oxyrinchus TaxID=40147 RepID=A0AAD8G321_ACIOX|nr:hypothetical protein AOXY_G16708 [Acipenser oxyrinchus oxyrinchus]
MKAEVLSVLILCSIAEESLAVTREYSIAAVELDWDYLHTEYLETIPTKRNFPAASHHPKEEVQLYTKAVYWEYTDSTFTTPKSKPTWMGILGPTIRAEVNDKVVVHFKNLASRSYSVNPIGISYWKQSEGAEYSDETSPTEKGDDAVAPGEGYQYVWDILPSIGPTLGDPQCLTYSYSSHVHTVRDFNSGLIGALLVCKANPLKADGSQNNVQEFVLLFSVFDEAQSWYGEADMFRERIQNTRKTVKKQYHSINGFVNSTLTGLKMCQKKAAHWHLIGMGTAPEIHSVRFHGHTLLVQNHRKVSFDMTPMTFATAQLTAVNTGRFLISCQIHTHQHDGMNAYFSVESCPEELQERQVTPDHDHEYEFKGDLLSGLFEMPPKLNVRSSLKNQPKKWEHYIAAEEVVWDYAPIIHNQRYRSLSTVYLEKGPQRIGKQYKKAVYVEYTDGTFRKRKPKNGPDRGIMGPVLRGETGDEFQITFKNLARHPFNIYPHGLTSVQPFVSKPSLEGKDLKKLAIQPNETFTYSWKITLEDGPTKSDPRCLTRFYHSSLDPVRDAAAGLVGPLVICTVNTLNSLGKVVQSDKDRYLLFSIFDENKSWYINENLEKYCGTPSSVDPADPGFYNSNVMYSVNGYMYDYLNLKVCAGDVAFWHVINFGPQSDFLSVYFAGNTFELHKNVYEVVLTLFPMSGETVRMEPQKMGEWLMGAFNSNFRNRGMSAKYTVHNCDYDYRTGDPGLEDYYQILDYIGHSVSPRGFNKKNRTIVFKLCKKNSTTASGNITESPNAPRCKVKYVQTLEDKTEQTNKTIEVLEIPLGVISNLEIKDSPSVEGNQGKSQPRSIQGNTSTQIERTEKYLLPIKAEGDRQSMGTTESTNSKKAGFDQGEAAEESAPSDIEKELDPLQSTESEEGPVVAGSKEPSRIQECGSDCNKHRKKRSLESTKSPNHHDRAKLGDRKNGKKLLKKILNRIYKEDKKSTVSRHGNQVIKVASPVLDNSNQTHKRLSGKIQANLTDHFPSSHSIKTKELPPEETDSYYDYYSLGGNDTEEDYDSYDDMHLDLRTKEGKVHYYFIAAVEVMWDYGIKKPPQLISTREMRRGWEKFFPEYKKVVFREFLDGDFSQPTSRGEMEEHLGILGPVIRAEINDIITVVFKNLASRPYSFNLHGVYDRAMNQQLYDSQDGTTEGVQPNEMHKYYWKVTKQEGPTETEFDCKTWAYYSSTNPEKDINSGLVGPLLICKPNTLDRFFGRQLNIQEFSLLFMVFDETKSWYMEENINRFCKPPCQVNRNDLLFKRSNKFNAINGYVAETLPGLVMAQHHLVRWHLLNLGSEGEVHTVHFHGQSFTVRTDQEHRMGVYSLYPGTFGTVEMRPGKVGSWLVDCMIGEYQLSGMRAQFLVYTPKCAQPLGMASGRIADSQITSSPPYGEWLPRLARLDMSGSVNAWSGQSSKSWIQVDLLRPMLIHGISTQGAKQRFSDYFIAQFQISYSTDQESWKRYRGNVTHSEKIFMGNVDGSGTKENTLSPPIIAQYIRVLPLSFNNRPTLRMELIGCDLNSCSMPLGMERGLIQDNQISASSFHENWYSSWKPSLARLNLKMTYNAWRPKANNPHEWLKVDFGEVKRITGIITQGAKRLMMPMFVTEFTISFSNDGVTWKAVLEKQVPRVQVFQGNTDYNTEALNTFQPPIFSRYIRIHPKGWQNEIALRVEFLGCDTQQ